MKNRLMILLAVCAIACTPQADQSMQSTPEGQPVEVEKSIVIGLDDNYPPMGFRDDQGNLTGSDIELATLAAERLGRKVEFKPIDWASKEIELSSGKIDVIWNGLTITDERKQNMLFSAPYQKSGQVITLKKSSSVQKLDDLKGKVIAIQEGSTAESSLQKNPQLAEGFKEVKRYPDMAAIYMDLKLGRVDGAIVDEPLSRYYTTKDPESFRILPERFSVEYDAVGIAKGNEALQADINRVLDEMYRDGTTKAIFEKWFGEDISMPIVSENAAQQ